MKLESRLVNKLSHSATICTLNKTRDCKAKQLDCNDTRLQG
jgi:hypothetical protein